MSQLRFYRAILSHECATLSRDKVADAATLSQTNTASVLLFPFRDPPSQTQFQNGEIVPYLIFSEHLH